MFILDIIRQNEYSYIQLNELLEVNCESNLIVSLFRKQVEDLVSDINNLFDSVKAMRDCQYVESNSVAGLYLRKVSIHFDRLTHQACSRLYDDLKTYLGSELKRKAMPIMRQPRSPRTTRSSRGSCVQDIVKSPKSIYHINHETTRLQANEQRAMNPKDLNESLRRPNNSSKSDASFLRYLNLLRVNEAVGSKNLLMAYFDMVSDSVPLSYSALNHAIWFLHHGEYHRALECLQECYCCAQEADDDKCLLIALMWLSRILIQAKQKNSSKYNVIALLELVKKRSQKSGMSYVQAMASMTLEQLNGPKDDCEALKKCSETLKQVAVNSRQHNHFLASLNQPNPLDKDDESPSAEILAVRNSMNDVLAMYYALLSAHLNLKDACQSSALASQTLLHLDLIEKCGNEDVFLVNENTFIAIRNLGYHVWNLTKDIQLVREILVGLCSNNIPTHRTDTHSIWRQAFSEISFEYYMEQENWVEAKKMISVIAETDYIGAKLRHAELLKAMEALEESLFQVDELLELIEKEELSQNDPATSETETPDRLLASQTIEHRAFIKAKSLLLRAVLLKDETLILESLRFSMDNGFVQIQNQCLKELSVESC